MKNKYSFKEAFLLLLVGSCMIGCNEENDVNPLDNRSDLVIEASATDIKLNEDTPNDIALTLNWTKADPISSEYSLCRLSSRRRAILLWSVSENSPPNRTYTFQRIRLSASICSSNRSTMNLFMTSSTKCNGFPFPCNHVSFPRLFILKILEFTYMVHFQMPFSTT